MDPACLLRWLPVGFALLALAQLGWSQLSSLAIAALAVGVIGSLIIGMVTRTARGLPAGRCGPRAARSRPTPW